MMYHNRSKRRVLIRLIAVLSITGVSAAILPFPHFDSQARTVDTMSPLRQSLSGLYGSK